MFEDRNAWAIHEMEEHRRQWYCQLCSYETSTSQGHLRHHLEQSHQMEQNGEQLRLLLNISSQPINKIDARECPFCDWEEILLKTASPRASLDSPISVTSDRFLGHLAHHLEQIALFAISSNISEPEGNGEADTLKLSDTYWRSQLAGVDTNQSQYGETERLHRWMLEDRRAQLEQKQLDIALARLRSSQGRDDGAEQLYGGGLVHPDAESDDLALNADEGDNNEIEMGDIDQYNPALVVSGKMTPRPSSASDLFSTTSWSSWRRSAGDSRTTSSDAWSTLYDERNHEVATQHGHDNEWTQASQPFVMASAYTEEQTPAFSIDDWNRMPRVSGDRPINLATNTPNAPRMARRPRRSLVEQCYGNQQDGTGVYNPSRTYTCEVCSGRFNTRADLNDHMRYHGDPIHRHRCHLCQQTFTFPRELRRHLASIHGNLDGF